MKADLTPFLASIESPKRAPSPLASSLPALEIPASMSPWLPSSQPPGPPAPPAMPAPITPPVDVDAIRAEAAERGRAEGLGETEALRARLAALVGKLEEAVAAIVPPSAELVADAAVAVIGAWTESSDRRALFAPIVHAWIARWQGEATARVHPSDVDAVRAEIGEAKLEVVADETIARGDIAIRAAALELTHQWPARLGELREAIAAALEEKP